jgi:hypothetical protein
MVAQIGSFTRFRIRPGTSGGKVGGFAEVVPEWKRNGYLALVDASAFPIGNETLSSAKARALRRLANRQP